MQRHISTFPIAPHSTAASCHAIFSGSHPCRHPCYSEPCLRRSCAGGLCPRLPLHFIALPTTLASFASCCIFPAGCTSPFSTLLPLRFLLAAVFFPPYCCTSENMPACLYPLTIALISCLTCSFSPPQRLPTERLDDRCISCKFAS